MKVSITRLAFLNATRNKTRSLLTAGIIVGGTALFIISISWLSGLWNQILESSAEASGEVRLVTPEHAARESLRPPDENLEDVDALAAAALATPGVTAAYPIVETGGTLTVGEEIGDVFGSVIGAPNGYYTDQLKAPGKLVEGRWLEPGKQELVLGWKLVQRTGAKLGDEVVVLGSTQDGAMSPIKGTLVGIARAGNPTIDRRVFLDLQTAQWMVDIPGGATKLLVWGEDYKDGPALGAALKANPALGSVDVADWTTLPPWGEQMGVMDAIKGVIMFMVAFLAALGVWNTMMMSVLERTGEIGVLRAMGMTRLGAVFLFVFEGIAIAILGGVVGVVAGVVPTLWMQSRGFQYPESIMEQVPFAIPAELFPELTADTILLAFLTAVITAVIGTFLPALRAASIQPDTAMRRN